MDSLVGYSSDDEIETDRLQNHVHHHHSGSSGAAAGPRRRDDDTNYDDVNMDMSEDSQAESEPELPPAGPEPAPRHARDDTRTSDESRDRDRLPERREKRRDSPPRPRGDRDKRSPRRDDRPNRSGKAERRRGSHDSGSSKRGLLGDRPDTKTSDSKVPVPALMDLKPFGGDAPPGYKSQDARDAVSPRFVDRSDRRERDKERERDRDRHSRRSEEKKSSRHEREHRSRSRGAHPPHPAHTAHPPPHAHTASSVSGERRGSPQSGDYRPSYKVNKKLEVMEKMGLQIKTPDGSMATAQQLRAAASEGQPPAAGLPSYYNPTAVNTNKIIDQVQKRKLLWSNKNKSEAEEAAKWSGTRFAQDNDGRQVSKFMRLMGIKEPAAVKPEPAVDPIKKQEELFQAMQAQYEVARATTHTMRGVGLGFQRGQY